MEENKVVDAIDDNDNSSKSASFNLFPTLKQSPSFSSLIRNLTKQLIYSLTKAISAVFAFKLLTSYLNRLPKSITNSENNNNNKHFISNTIHRCWLSALSSFTTVKQAILKQTQRHNLLNRKFFKRPFYRCCNNSLSISASLTANSPKIDLNAEQYSLANDYTSRKNFSQPCSTSEDQNPLEKYDHFEREKKFQQPEIIELQPEQRLGGQLENDPINHHKRFKVTEKQLLQLKHKIVSQFEFEFEFYLESFFFFPIHLIFILFLIVIIIVSTKILRLPSFLSFSFFNVNLSGIFAEVESSH